MLLVATSNQADDLLNDLRPHFVIGSAVMPGKSDHKRVASLGADQL